MKLLHFVTIALVAAIPLSYAASNKIDKVRLEHKWIESENRFYKENVSIDRSLLVCDKGVCHIKCKEY